MKAFKAPKTSLGDLDAEAAAVLITAAADVAIIVDAAGAVRDVAVNSEGLAEELADQDSWLGKPWTDTVAPDSRAKVEALLADADAVAGRQWRHVNLRSARGTSVPILFSAVRIGDGSRAVAFGRDLRQLSALQQRLLEAQQSLDRD